MPSVLVSNSCNFLCSSRVFDKLQCIFFSVMAKSFSMFLCKIQLLGFGVFLLGWGLRLLYFLFEPSCYYHSISCLFVFGLFFQNYCFSNYFHMEMFPTKLWYGLFNIHHFIS